MKAYKFSGKGNRGWWWYAYMHAYNNQTEYPKTWHPLLFFGDDDEENIIPTFSFHFHLSFPCLPAALHTHTLIISILKGVFCHNHQSVFKEKGEEQRAEGSYKRLNFLSTYFVVSVRMKILKVLLGSVRVIICI